jgi:hypothetical protein
MIFDAWAAGFVDGEGCVGLEKTGTPYISVTQKFLLPLMQLHDHYQVGRVKRHGDSAYRWVTRARKEVELLLRAWVPHLRTNKAQQAALMLAYLQGRLDIPRARELLARWKRREYRED